MRTARDQHRRRPALSEWSATSNLGGALMWRINAVLEFALILLLVGRRAHLRWPSLVAFLAVLGVRDAILLYADLAGAKLLYCWAYYIGSAIAIAAEVLLIREIALNLVGPLKTLRGIVARNVPAMTVVFILASTFASLPGHHAEGIPHIATIIYYCRRMDLGASLGCSCALIMLVGIAVSLKVQLSHGVRPVAIGLLIDTAFSYMQAVFYMDGAVAQAIFPSVRSAAYVITLVCFCASALSRRERPPSAQSIHTQGVRAHA